MDGDYLISGSSSRIGAQQQEELAEGYRMLPGLESETNHPGLGGHGPAVQSLASPTGTEGEPGGGRAGEVWELQSRDIELGNGESRESVECTDLIPGTQQLSDRWNTMTSSCSDSHQPDAGMASWEPEPDAGVGVQIHVFSEASSYENESGEDSGSGLEEGEEEEEFMGLFWGDEEDEEEEEERFIEEWTQTDGHPTSQVKNDDRVNDI